MAQTRRTSLETAVDEHIARMGQATAGPSRLELLDLLSQAALEPVDNEELVRRHACTPA